MLSALGTRARLVDAGFAVPGAPAVLAGQMTTRMNLALVNPLDQPTDSTLDVLVLAEVVGTDLIPRDELDHLLGETFFVGGGTNMTLSVQAKLAVQRGVDLTNDPGRRVINVVTQEVRDATMSNEIVSDTGVAQNLDVVEPLGLDLRGLCHAILDRFAIASGKVGDTEGVCDGRRHRLEHHLNIQSELMGVGVVADGGHLTTGGKMRLAGPDFVDHQQAVVRAGIEWELMKLASECQVPKLGTLARGWELVLLGHPGVGILEEQLLFQEVGELRVGLELVGTIACQAGRCVGGLPQVSQFLLD